jgi:CRP/FNR family transcriptional regulator, cyclic AMP receptor protein
MEHSISLENVVGFLVATPLFDGLDPAERADVVRIMEVRQLREGETVFREGDPGDAWYVLSEGEARVLKAGEAGVREIARLKKGDCFGEMAILDGSARSASVEAVTPVTVYRFRRSRFDDLLDQGSLGAYKLVVSMARVLSQRQRDLTRKLSELMDSRQPIGAGAGAGGDVERYLVSE